MIIQFKTNLNNYSIFHTSELHVNCCFLNCFRCSNNPMLSPASNWFIYFNFTRVNAAFNNTRPLMCHSQIIAPCLIGFGCDIFVKITKSEQRRAVTEFANLKKFYLLLCFIINLQKCVSGCHCTADDDAIAKSSSSRSPMYSCAVANCSSSPLKAARRREETIPQRRDCEPGKSAVERANGITRSATYR